ncbi:MAG: 16S rRNA (uracil(1498)-N(3))-methyltransferase [Sphingopyxis sp.]
MTSTPKWPPRSAPRLFVEEELRAGQARAIDGGPAHYLGQVMRVKPGDTVILLDNISGEWAARVAAVGKRRVELSVVELLRVREAVPDLWLCIAPIKKAHFDMVIEKATELGVAHIVPVLMRRCVVDKVNAARMRAIATEAAEQCARTALPHIGDMITLPHLLADWPTDRTLFHADEAGGTAASAAFAAHRGPAALLIGPEGGFDDTERAIIGDCPQSRAISLGPRILRAETAAIAGAALWMAQAGDWGGRLDLT